jgi:Domain of Unknown Function (DUF928)
MKSRSMVTWMLRVGLALAIPLAGMAADGQKDRPVSQAPTAQTLPVAKPPMGYGTPGGESGSVRKIVYTPPRVGAPAGRVGGGTRGPGGSLPVLSVLAPDHTGLTTQEQPALYWYIAAPTTHTIELTVISEQAIHPLLETRLPSPSQAGVQRLRLAEHGVRLAPGVQYRWFVALIPDADNRSQDVIASGSIEHTEQSAAVRAQLAQAGTADVPFIYAQAGLWYDALAAISAQIEADPANALVRLQRAELLAQVELAEVAAYEMQRAR